MENCKNQKPTYIDLFAGCGGLSLGLHNAGWQGLFAIEKNIDAFKTLEYNLIDRINHFNWPSWLPRKNNEIDEVLNNYKDHLLSLRGQVDMVAGGPPCQGFSTVGRRNEDDVRNGLIRSYLKFIMYTRPKVIFFENVKGFTLKFSKNKSKGIAYSSYVLRVLKWFKYEVYSEMVDFSEFGIPQKRTRFILVGIRKDIVESRTDASKSFFDRIKENKINFLISKDLPLKPTLGDAISDLLQVNGKVPSETKNFQAGVYAEIQTKYQRLMRLGVESITPDSHRFANHKEQTVAKYSYILKNSHRNKGINRELKNYLQTNKHIVIPLDQNSPSPTLTTLPDDYIHYSEPRILTVREYARIQTFPDYYEFKGKYTTGGKARIKEVPRYTQIGNAIPPLFGEQTGIVLKDWLYGRK